MQKIYLDGADYVQIQEDFRRSRSFAVQPLPFYADTGELCLGDTVWQPVAGRGGLSVPDSPHHPNNWFVRNEAMANSDQATLHRLALQRVVGKPFPVTEYDHPARNQYAAEGALMLAAHAALQEWDGLFLFDYGSASGKGQINSYFEQCTHPAKWGLARACAHCLCVGMCTQRKRLFVPRSHVSRSWRRCVRPGVDLDRRQLCPAGRQGYHAPSRCACVRTEPDSQRRVAPSDVPMPGNQRVSDTGELLWNRGQEGDAICWLDRASPKQQWGSSAGARSIWGDKLTLEGREAPLNGFGVVAITVLQEKPVWCVLITTISTAENTGWNFRDLGDNRVTVGSSGAARPRGLLFQQSCWHCPIPRNESAAGCWERTGVRKSAISAIPQGSDCAALELSPNHRTLWYAVEVRPQ